MEASERTAFGDQLRRRRVEAALTQEELAERARLSARTVADLERGINPRPRRHTARQLAEALGLTASERDAFEAAARRGARIPAEQGKRWRPTGSFLGASPTRQLVARGAELSRIRHAIEAVLAGRGRLVLLVGEAGVGKTRLAQELAGELERQDLQVATGRCYEPQQAVPFYPFHEALGTLVVDAPAGIRDAIPRRWPYLGGLLPEHVLPVLFHRPVASVEDEPHLFLRAVSGFLLTLAEERPVAILLDDFNGRMLLASISFDTLPTTPPASRSSCLAPTGGTP